MWVSAKGSIRSVFMNGQEVEIKKPGEGQNSGAFHRGTCRYFPLRELEFEYILRLLYNNHPSIILKKEFEMPQTAEKYRSLPYDRLSRNLHFYGTDFDFRKIS